MKKTILVPLALFAFLPCAAWAAPADQGATLRAEKPAADEKKAKPPQAKPPAKSSAVTPAVLKPGAEKPAKADAKSEPAANAPAAKQEGQAEPQKEAGQAKPLQIDRKEALRRADEFLNASPVLTADFVQIGGDGKRAEGTLHVHRPGRMRFEYARPATLEVVSDGATVAVRDTKLNTQDLYFIEQTPLKFLLKEKINLENDVKVQDVVTDDAGTAIFIEDKATFGGTSHIKLIFDSKTFKLKQWQVTDPQGYETLVTLFNIERMKAPDPNIFKVTR